MRNLTSSFNPWLRTLTTIALGALYCLAPSGTYAQPAPACKPVAYLFRHAEETANAAGTINTNTLKPEGKQHAIIYATMLRNFQNRMGFCPVLDVFAMARKNAPNAPQFANGIGTTNPFFTGKPFANAAVVLLECQNERINCNPFLEESLPEYFSPTTSTDPTIVEEPGRVQDNGLLYEYMTNTATRDDLRELVKDAVESGFSVAFFWSSQGMGEIAKVLGSPIGAYASNSVPAKANDYKAPRNSVFVFSNYNSTGLAEPGAKVAGTFNAISTTGKLAATTGQFLQCFNYAPGKGLDSHFPGTNQIAYFCKFGEDLSAYSPKIPEVLLGRLKGAVCDVSKLSAYGDPNVYAGYGIEDGNQCF